jgi:hypothetical protein
LVFALAQISMLLRRSALALRVQKVNPKRRRNRRTTTSWAEEPGFCFLLTRL